jgi:HAE1 family hydrophobic/amphiphilic exporter-1
VRIADLSIRRPILGSMLVGSFVVLGLASISDIGVDLFPRVEFPYVAVTTALPGATPETVEGEVTDAIEDHVNTIAGIKELRSRSSEGLSEIFIQFELEEDVDVKAQDVRDKVALAVPELPLDAEPPVVEKIDPDSSPILSVVVAGDRPVRELTDFAEDVVEERLQRVPGVGSVTRAGGREREIRIWLDADRLRSYALTADDVIRAVRTEHAEIPGGTLESAARTAEFSVKTKGEVEAVGEFADIVVAYREGAPTTVGDVARVEDGTEDERSWAELDGQPGISLAVRRQSGRNTVEVARAIRRVVAELQAEAPPGIEITIARDTARFIEHSARDVAVDIALGAALAVLVTLAFMRTVRATLIVSLAIPTSIAATLFVFYAFGFTFNLLTLMALSVAIGILVDDAIVVLEVVQRRIDAGQSPRAAASEGSAEVGAAVIAGTATVLAVFLPIAFMSGVIGRFFFEYGLAISFAVAFSLLVALTLTPMLCARVLRRETRLSPAFQKLEVAYTRLEASYARVLRAALRRRLLVGGVAVASVWGALWIARGIPLEFGPKADRSEFEVMVELPQGTGMVTAQAAARRVSEAMRQLEYVRRVFTTVGGDGRGRIHEIVLYVQTTPKQDRRVSQWEIMERARERLLEAAPDARQISVNEVPWISGGGFASYNVEFAISGPSLAELERIGEAVVARLQADPLFLDAKSSYELGKPELQVHVDRRRAADLGVPVRALADTVRALVGGVEVASYQEHGSRYDVRVRLEESQRDEIAEIGRLQVRAAEGFLVDLANVASLQVASGPAQIERRDRGRQVTIFANTPGEVALGSAVERLDEIVAEVGMPAGYAGYHTGASERMQDSAVAVQAAFLAALVALFMILAAQFESLSQPAVIMVSAPLSFVGAFAALALTGVPMSIFAQIGLVALMGIVMKNGILLVDCANAKRGELDARGAMLAAGPERLRPVLMTALSTIAGMIPVGLSTSDGGEFRQPMAILVIGGLVSSTLLTLLVVPVVYTAIEDARAAASRLAFLEIARRAVSALGERVRACDIRHKLRGWRPVSWGKGSGVGEHGSGRE